MNTLFQNIQHQLEDSKIQDIMLFDVFNDFTSHIMMGTGTSVKHISSIADKIIDIAKLHHYTINIEGYNSTWILIDLQDIVIHLLTQEAKDKYNLQELYLQAIKNS